MRPARGAAQFSLLAAASGVWSSGYLIGFFNTQLSWKLALLRLEYLGIVCANYFWILFIIVYIYHDPRLTRRVVWSLGIIPVITLIQVATIGHHPHFYTDFQLITKAGLVLFSKTYGPGFYLWTAYAYIIFTTGGLIFIRGVLRMPRQLKRQALPIAIVTVLSLIFNFSYISGFNPIAPYDPSPLSFIITGILFITIIRRYKFLDIVPVAHNRVIENVNTGVIVIDTRSHILYINPAAEKILVRTQEQTLGLPLKQILPEYSQLEHQHLTADTSKIEIVIGGHRQIYEIQATPLSDRSGESAGRIIMLFDISDRKSMEKEQAHLINELQIRNSQLCDALEEIKSLKGIIPICSSCKKIRDDKGYWNLLEAYIEDHSDASFSHGMCPGCSEKMYGDQDWYKKIKKKKQ